MRDDVDDERRSILALMPQSGEDVSARRQSLDDCADVRNLLFRPDVPDRQLEQLLARVSILSDGRVVGGEKASRFGVPHEHRQRMMLEDGAVACVAFPNRDGRAGSELAGTSALLPAADAIV